MRQPRRPRPYIPLKIRVEVAIRQLVERYGGFRQAIDATSPIKKFVSQSDDLATFLFVLFGNSKTHLDHDPALINRPYNPKIKNVAARYTPNANDPNYLIYRTKEDHDIKTHVRGDGAQYSDLALRRKLKRIERNRDPKRRKKKIPQRVNPWPKRKFRSRK